LGRLEALAKGLDKRGKKEIMKTHKKIQGKSLRKIIQVPMPLPLYSLYLKWNLKWISIHTTVILM